MDLFEFCQSLPKVELHAHINGSLSKELLKELLEERRRQTEDGLIELSHAVIDEGDTRSLDEGFAMFKVVHKVVNCEKTVYKVTKQVVKDFADDGVLYLELRSTPRAVPSTGMTKRSYVDSVVTAIRDAMIEYKIIVRFLLAIDHRNSIEEAEDTVELAVEFMKQSPIVVGVDLSGDLSVSDARQFIPVFKSAKERGLRLAFHLAELPGRNDEVMEMLKLLPDRVGHATFLHPARGGTNELVDIVTANKIPLEMCLTSNVKTRSVDTYDQHQFKFWYDRAHPCVICTDDKGVFSTTLTNELSIAAETFKLTKSQLWDLSFQAINFALAEDSIKQQLRQKFLEIKKSLEI